MIDPNPPLPAAVAHILLGDESEDVFSADQMREYAERMVEIRLDIMKNISKFYLSDDDIIKIAQKTQTAEPGRDGYILPLSFARAILDARNFVKEKKDHSLMCSRCGADRLKEPCQDPRPGCPIVFYAGFPPKALL